MTARKILACLALSSLLAFGLVAPACSTLQGPTRVGVSVLDGARQVLSVLAAEDGTGGLLDLALGHLERGDLDACRGMLRMVLDQAGGDPRVRAVLDLIESELPGG